MEIPRPERWAARTREKSNIFTAPKWATDCSGERREKANPRFQKKKRKVRAHLGNIHTYIKYGPAQLYMFLDSLKFYKLLLPAWLEGKQLKVDTVRGPIPAKTGKSAAKSRNGDVRSCYVTESLPTVIYKRGEDNCPHLGSSYTNFLRMHRIMQSVYVPFTQRSASRASRYVIVGLLIE